MSERFPSRDVPMCESSSERDDEHGACIEAGTPFVGVVRRDEGHVVEYDISTAHTDDGSNFELRDDTITELEDTIDDYVEEAETNNAAGEIGWSLGSQNGHFVGLPRETARELATEFASVVRDPENLRER